MAKGFFFVSGGVCFLSIALAIFSQFGAGGWLSPERVVALVKPPEGPPLVVVADGRVFERGGLAKWLKSGSVREAVEHHSRSDSSAVR